MILFLAGTAGHQQGDLRGRRDRRRRVFCGRRHRLPPSDGAAPEADDHARRRPADHPALPGVRPGAPDDPGADRTTRPRSWSATVYQTAFRDSDLGQASAMAVFLFRDHRGLLGASVRRRDGNRTDETEPRLCLALRPPGRAGLRLARADAVDGLAVVPAERRPWHGRDRLDLARAGADPVHHRELCPTCSPSAGHLSGS